MQDNILLDVAHQRIRIAQARLAKISSYHRPV